MKKLYLENEEEVIKNKYPDNYQFENTNELKIIEVENGIVHNHRYKSEYIYDFPHYGGVSDENYNFIEESARYDVFGIERTKVLMCGKVYEEKYDDYIDEEVVFLGLLIGHWGHFILESIVRLWYFLDEKNKNKKACYIYEGCGEDFLYFFEWFGLKKEQLIRIDKNTKFKKVIVPEVSSTHTNIYHKKYKETINKIKEKFEAYKYKKVYISRDKFVHPEYGAKAYGEKVIEKIFENNGYKVIYPEDTGDEEMIKIMKGAEYVAGLQGSAINNILFANDNINIILLFRSKNTDKQSTVALLDYLTNKNATCIDAYLISISYKSFYREFGQPYLIGMTEEIKNFFDDNNFKYNMKEVYKNLIDDINNYLKNFMYTNSQFYKDKKFFIVQEDIKNSINRFKVYEEYNPLIKDYFDLIRKMIFPLLEKNKISNNNNNTEKNSTVHKEYNNTNYYPAVKVRKVIDKIVWWIPIKQLRNKVRNNLIEQCKK